MKLQNRLQIKSLLYSVYTFFLSMTTALSNVFCTSFHDYITNTLKNYVIHLILSPNCSIL